MNSTYFVISGLVGFLSALLLQQLGWRRLAYWSKQMEATKQHLLKRAAELGQIAKAISGPTQARADSLVAELEQLVAGCRREKEEQDARWLRRKRSAEGLFALIVLDAEKTPLARRT